MLNYLTEIFLKQHKSFWPKRSLIVLTMTLVLTACGYHLRGAVEIPKELEKIYLQGASADLYDQFSRSMRSSSGQLVDSIEKAGLVISFFNENMQRRALSLSARGRANDFELDYRFDYEIADAKNVALSGREPLEIRREYFNDQTDIIAKDNEEKVIRNEMYQQAVRTILNRARSVVQEKQKK